MNWTTHLKMWSKQAWMGGGAPNKVEGMEQVGLGTIDFSFTLFFF